MAAIAKRTDRQVQRLFPISCIARINQRQHQSSLPWRTNGIDILCQKRYPRPSFFESTCALKAPVPIVRKPMHYDFVKVLAHSLSAHPISKIMPGCKARKQGTQTIPCWKNSSSSRETHLHVASHQDLEQSWQVCVRHFRNGFTASCLKTKHQLRSLLPQICT